MPRGPGLLFFKDRQGQDANLESFAFFIYFLSKEVISQTRRKTFERVILDESIVVETFSVSFWAFEHNILIQTFVLAEHF